MLYIKDMFCAPVSSGCHMLWQGRTLEHYSDFVVVVVQKQKEEENSVLCGVGYIYTSTLCVCVWACKDLHPGTILCF